MTFDYDAHLARAREQWLASGDYTAAMEIGNRLAALDESSARWAPGAAAMIACALARLFDARRDSPEPITLTDVFDELVVMREKGSPGFVARPVPGGMQPVGDPHTIVVVKAAADTGAFEAMARLALRTVARATGRPERW